MKQFWEKVKAIPRWGWFFGFLYFGLQYGMYRLAEWISRLIGNVSYSFAPKIPAIDDAIPVIPVFAVIYLFSYFHSIKA